MSGAYRFSIAANVVLLAIAALLISRTRPTSTVPSVPAAAIPPTAAAQPTQPTAPPAATPARRQISATGAVTPNVVAQLERMGIPRDVVVDAIADGVNRQTDKQLRELQRRYAPGPVPSREFRLLSRESAAEQIRELKVALGEDGYRAWDKEQTLHELNRGKGANVTLSDAEAEQAYRLQKSFDDKNQALQEAMEDGVADMADVNTLQAQAKQQLEQQLEQLLGPDRFNQLRGNTEPAVAVLQQYASLNPSPAQAQAVLQADTTYRDQQAALAKQLSANPADAATLAAQLKELQDAHDASLRQVFGADAYDKVEQQQDLTFQTLQQNAATWNLSDSQVQAVYLALHAFQDQAQRLRAAADLSETAGQPLNRHEIEATILQAQQQLQTSLASQIGGELANRLQQNGLLDPSGPSPRR